MKRIGKTSWKRLVPAFAAAVLAIGATATTPAHATDPCTDDLYLTVRTFGVTSVSPTNVAVAALADGEFEMTWDNPREESVSVQKNARRGVLSPGAVPAGLVVGFCAVKSYESTGMGTLEERVCKCAEGAPCSSEDFASSITSVTFDSCYSTLPSGRRTLCAGGTYDFKVSLLPVCNISAPWSDTVSAESTYVRN